MSRRSRRNAVLAPVTRWLWWSPWRLLSTTALTLIILAVVLAALRSGHRQHERSEPAPAELVGIRAADTDAAVPVGASDTVAMAPALVATASNTSRSPMPTSVTATIALPAAANDPRKAAAAATAWTKLWARPTVAANTWLADLTPGTFRDYLPTLATVDPANVPADALAGSASVQTFAAGAARVSIPVHAATNTSSTGTSSAHASAPSAMHTVELQLIWYPTNAAGHWVVSGVDGH